MAGRAPDHASARDRRNTKANYPLSLDTATAAATAAGTHERSGDLLTVQGDNFAWLPDGTVDLVLTDPPFNIAKDTSFHTWDKNTINSYRFDRDKGWDSYTEEEFIGLLGAWSQEFSRVLRRGGSFAVFCADTYLSHLIGALTAAGLNPRRTLTWRKPNAVPVNRKTMMMSACEYVVVGVKGTKATFNSDVDLGDLGTLGEVETVVVADKAAAVVEKHVRAAVRQVLTAGVGRGPDVAAAASTAIVAAAEEAAARIGAMYVEGDTGPQLRACVPNHVAFNGRAGNRLHPTEKPVELLRYLVTLLSRPDDLVLDPFGGSGSTGEAATSARRRAIIVERDPEFYKKLSARLHTRS